MKGFNIRVREARKEPYIVWSWDFIHRYNMPTSFHDKLRHLPEYGQTFNIRGLGVVLIKRI